ncbi:hypothetical protein KPATCC21470_1505 [Kitasatospora purpeofusca]
MAAGAARAEYRVLGVGRRASGDWWPAMGDTPPTVDGGR